MAFAIKEMSQLAYTGADGGNHLWFYANSASDDVTAANFFDDALDDLPIEIGDFILTGGGLIRYVSDNDGGVTLAAVEVEDPA